jgi:hypothetical protein
MKRAAVAALRLAVATPAMAQVPCIRQDTSFSCADGSVLAIYDDPWRGRGRGGVAMGGGYGLDRAGGDWWKDEVYVHGPRGEQCLLHGNHVHCNGTLSDTP